MKALQYVTLGQPPKIVDIAKPNSGPGQVLLKVTAAGACHSDGFTMGLSKEEYVYGLPLTLGHEGAGIVAEPGEGVENLTLGNSVCMASGAAAGATTARRARKTIV